MKISRIGKQRAAARLDQVMRPILESHKDYRWWNYQDTEPAEGYVLDEYVRWEPAYPQPDRVVTRKPKREALSRTALRKRLYRAHVPKTQWAELLDRFAGRALWQMPGAPTIRGQYGYAIARAVTRHVHVRFMVFDEYPTFASPGLTEILRSFRSVNQGSVMVTQSIADFPELAAKVTALSQAA